MAATRVDGGRDGAFVHLTAIDADWDYGSDRPLSSIQFNPGSDGTDVLVVKADSASGPEIMNVTADAANNESCKYFDLVPCRVFIDYSECTLSSGHSVEIVFGEGSMWNG